MQSTSPPNRLSNPERFGHHIWRSRGKSDALNIWRAYRAQPNESISRGLAPERSTTSIWRHCGERLAQIWRTLHAPIWQALRVTLNIQIWRSATERVINQIWRQAHNGLAVGNLSMTAGRCC